jgi:excisionase family DNA binding protein
MLDVTVYYVIQELYSVEQVAERLGLHVRTVRNYVRDGRLKAVRIGKQYRITRADLEALTGGPVPESPRAGAGRVRSVQVASVVEIDAVERATADRVSNTIMAAAAGLRIHTIYDEELAHLKIVIFADAATTAAMLHIIDTLLVTDS